MYPDLGAIINGKATRFCHPTLPPAVNGPDQFSQGVSFVLPDRGQPAPTEKKVPPIIWRGYQSGPLSSIH